MKNKFTLSLFAITFIFYSCHNIPKSQKLEVVTTLFPLYDFTKVVLGNKGNVSLLLPPGTEAHSYEPKPRDIIAINESALFLYLGESMEPWVDGLLESLNNKKLLVVEVNDAVFTYLRERGDLTHEGVTDEEGTCHDENCSDKEHKSDHPHAKHDNEKSTTTVHNCKDHSDSHSHDTHHHETEGGLDPHTWLDFELAQVMVMTIANALSKIDPQNGGYYSNNARAYNQKLNDLDISYRQTLSRCQYKTILYGGHFAFGYQAKRYGLTHISPYKGFSPNSEPTPQKIAEIIEITKKHKTTTLFYEELLEPKVANAIAKESGVSLALLHAAHNLSADEIKNNVTFLEIMKSNLEKLKIGLDYQ